MRSSKIQRFKNSDVIEIHDGIMFVFYPGLPHVQEQLNDKELTSFVVAATQLLKIEDNLHAAGTYLIPSLPPRGTYFPSTKVSLNNYSFG